MQHLQHPRLYAAIALSVLAALLVSAIAPCTLAPSKAWVIESMCRSLGAGKLP